MIDKISNWLISLGLKSEFAKPLSWLIEFAAVIVLAVIVNFAVKKIIVRIIEAVIKRSASKWDDAFASRHVFVRLSHLAPALVIYFSAGAFPEISIWIERLSMAYMLIVGLSVIYGFLSAAGDVYGQFDIAKHRPIKGYIQLTKIFLAVVIAILVISVLIGKSPALLLGGVGALTAIIILVFRDTILGLVASVQLTSNDMVRIGDWIEMPKFGADGDVIDISLHTVKVQNWDKTIVMIPTYSLISDSFKNWRGMSESGGRRIKRAVNIDMNSVKFVDQEMYERLSKIQILRPYLESRKAEIEEYNRTHNVDRSELVNGRNMTNLGTFRAYIKAYLANHPKIHKEMTMMVRHLAPGEHGIPIQIYAFSADQAWVNYEGIQADIFDHILSVVPRFDLRVYQSPSGRDISEVLGKISGGIGR